VREREEIVRVGILLAQGTFKAGNLDFSAVFLCSLNVVFPAGEVRVVEEYSCGFESPDPPPRMGRNDIHFAVAVEVAEIRPFAPELIAELNFLEGVQEVILRWDQDGGRKQ
jgi:hypothetical protein